MGDIYAIFRNRMALLGGNSDREIYRFLHNIILRQLGRALTPEDDIAGCKATQHISQLPTGLGASPCSGGVRRIPAYRRWGVMERWNLSDSIDQDQEVENWLDPSNGFAQAAAVIMGRAMDLAIIHAMNASVRAGKSGEMVVKFPSTQRISAGFSGMNMDKLREAGRMLRSVQLRDATDQYYIGLTARQLDNLLASTKRYSPDHAAARALAKGETSHFLGFEFIHCEQLPKTDTTCSVFAWMKSGLCLGIGIDAESTTDGQPGHNHTPRICAGLRIGAVRLAETKVVQIDCWDSD